MNFFVPISFFKGTPKSELWCLDTKTGVKKCLFTETTPSSHAVSGKGMTGIAKLDDTHYVTCDFNRVAIIDARTWSVVKVADDPEFNDLHQLSVIDNQIILSNTGSDSIVLLDKELKLIKRISLISAENLQKRILGSYTVNCSYYDQPQDVPEYHLRKVPDTLHINHAINYQSSLLATSFERKALINGKTGDVISNELEEHPHDGTIFQNKIWLTTVSGKIYCSLLQPKFQFTEHFDLFSQAEFHGWCRGLCFSNNKMYVGITEIYEKNNRTAWLNQPIEKTRTGIYEVDLTHKIITNFFDFSTKEGSRIFSILPYD